MHFNITPIVLAISSLTSQNLQFAAITLTSCFSSLCASADAAAIVFCLFLLIDYLYETLSLLSFSLEPLQQVHVSPRVIPRLPQHRSIHRIARWIYWSSSHHTIITRNRYHYTPRNVFERGGWWREATLKHRGVGGGRAVEWWKFTRTHSSLIRFNKTLMILIADPEIWFIYWKEVTSTTAWPSEHAFVVMKRKIAVTRLARVDEVVLHCIRRIDGVAVERCSIKTNFWYKLPTLKCCNM